MVEKTSLSDFAARLQESKYHLLARISFESRSIAIPTLIRGDNWESTKVFVSRPRSEAARQNIEKVKNHYLKELIPIELAVTDPLIVATTLQNEISSFIGVAKGRPAIIDITSFRREELLMVLAILRISDREAFAHWNLAYVGAQNMGEWLSGKVTAYRSVLGYPGEIKPSLQTRLVLLVGFETLRARSIIETYEPSRLVLGMGRKSESISVPLYERNKQLFDELAREYRASIEAEFEFSARDPTSVVHELEDVLENREESNVVIAPLHTKLSTVGVGLYGLKHSSTQVCYAPVEGYNETAYSAPGKDVYLVPLMNLFS